MKFKKIIASVLTAVLCIGLITLPAQAESGWTVSYSGTVNTDRTKYFAEVTNQYKYNGEASMLIKYPGTQVEGNYAEIRGKTEKKMYSGDYTLTFYAKGSRSALTEVIIGDGITAHFSDMTSVAVAATDVPSGEKSWFKYTYDFKYTEQSEDYIIFRFNGGTSSMALDDVSIAEAGTEDNIVFDPGFESVDEQSEEEEEYDTTDYRAKRLIAEGGSGIINLSWVNPATSDLSGITIYRITEDGREFITNELSIKPSQLVMYSVTDILPGANLFQIVFQFKNKEPFSYYLSAAESASTYSTGYGKWGVNHYHFGKASFTPARTYIDTEEKHSGDASLKIISNIAPEIDETLNGNNYIRVHYPVAFKSNTSYCIKMWVKSENLENISFNCDWSHGSVIPAEGTKDWKEYTFDVHFGDEERNYIFIITEHKGVCWIDDVSITELDENGEAVEELVDEGGFEDLLNTEVGELYTAEVSDIAKDFMTVSYTTYSSQIKYVNLYRKVFENYEYFGTVSKEITDIPIYDLDMGSEYSFKLAPVNSDLFEGEAIELTAVTDIPDYELSEPELYKGSGKTAAISGSGKYSIRQTVKNYKIEDMTIAQCVAVYKDGVLQKFFVTDKTLEPKSMTKPAVRIDTEFTIGEGTGWSVEVYILDSVEELNLLQDEKIFN